MKRPAHALRRGDVVCFPRSGFSGRVGYASGDERHVVLVVHPPMPEPSEEIHLVGTAPVRCWPRWFARLTQMLAP